MRRQKYNAKKITLDGVTFASQREGARYLDLKLLLRAGEIADLELQPKFQIHTVNASGELILCGKYTADFRYTTQVNGARVTVVEDVKSKATATTAYRLRKKLVEAAYGINIVEV